MKRTAKDNIGIARMVSVQTISRRSLGYGLNPGTRPPAVSRIIDGHEIYSDRKCDFFLGQPPEDREHIRHHLIGRFYHPSLASTQFDYGGDAKVAVDTRFPGWYVLWIGTKLDPGFMPGTMPWFWDYVCWTQKVKSDSVYSAGARMFKCWLLDQGFAEPDEDHIILDVEEWWPSRRLEPLFNEICIPPTKNSTEP